MYMYKSMHVLMSSYMYVHVYYMYIKFYIMLYKTMKLKGEVGIAGSKSTRTRFVGIITSTVHPYACFS